jgi:hypothetical protein
MEAERKRRLLALSRTAKNPAAGTEPAAMEDDKALRARIEAEQRSAAEVDPWKRIALDVAGPLPLPPSEMVVAKAATDAAAGKIEAERLAEEELRRRIEAEGEAQAVLSQRIAAEQQALEAARRREQAASELAHAASARCTGRCAGATRRRT